MTIANTWAIHSVNARYLKKGTCEATSPRPAEITVTPGKIEIRSTENKFPTISLKTTDIVKKPKAPQGKSSTWIFLDCAQHIQSKYQYVNIQVTDPTRVADIVETLNRAWIKVNDLDDSGLFPNNSDEVARPVHHPPPNARPQAAVAGSRRNLSKIEVDQESSATHQGFNSDFASTTQAKTQKASELKGLFTEYGIENSKEVKPEPVHKPQQQRPHQATSSTKRQPAGNSYSSQAQRSNKNYRPVDKTMEVSAGIGEMSFYGNTNSSVKSPSNVPPPRPTSALRQSTKDSLDAGGMRVSRVKMTPGIREEEPKKVQDGQDDEEQNYFSPPQKQKSLTSDAAAKNFDKAFGTSNRNTNPPEYNKRLTNAFVPSSNKRAGLYNSSSYSQQPSSRPSTSATSSLPLKPYAYKESPNIGNSCYMNATLQILAACPIFVEQVNTAFEKLGDDRSACMRVFNGLMRWLTNQHATKTRVAEAILEKMRSVLKTLDLTFEQGGGRAQQDAEECLTAILGAISDECTGQGFRKRDSVGRRSIGSPSKTPIKRPSTSDTLTASTSATPSIDEQKKKKKSGIVDPVDLLEVKWRDVKTCASCGNTRKMDAMEHRVHMAIGEEPETEEGETPEPWTVKSLQQLLFAEVSHREIIGDFKCEKCLKKSECIGTKQYVQFGEYIIIVLKRFGHDEYGHVCKLKTPIRVPLYLEMADFMNGQERPTKDPLNDTIMLDTDMERKSQKTEEKVEEQRKELSSLTPMISSEGTPKSKVTGLTQEWMEEEGIKTEQSTVAVSPFGDAMGDDLEFGEEVMEEEEEEKEKKEVKMENDTRSAGQEGEQPMEEEVEKVKKEIKEEEVIQISSQSDADEGVVTAVEGEEDSKTTSSSKRKSDVTPPLVLQRRGGLRMETPSTVVATTLTKDEVVFEQGSTPTRKRPRQRAQTLRERHERLSTGSHSSLCHSEPTRNEKRSRLDGRRSGEAKSPDSFSPVVHEVTIDDHDDEEEDERRRRRSSLEKKKACWAVDEPKMEKSEERDPFEFELDDDDQKQKPKETKPKKGKLEVPIKKAPLTPQNGQPKGDSPVKAAGQRRKQKGENVDPSPTKAAMEQSGGGVKRKDEPADEKESKKTKTEETTEEVEVKMEEETEERNDNRDRMEHVTRRSKARQSRVLPKEVEEKKEEEEGADEDEEEEEEDDPFFAEGSTKEDKETPRVEYGSQEGGFVKEGEEELSAESVVQETPPDEMEQEERKEKSKVEEEDGDSEGRLVIDEEGYETAKEENGDAGTDSTMDALCLDTPGKMEQKEEREGAGKEQKEHSDALVGLFAKIAKHAPKKEDGMVEPVLSPDVSPVKMERSDKTPRKQEKEVKDEEEETEEQKKKRKEREAYENRERKDVQNAQWNKLFADTDPPPPRDHITFRPVDNRWMASKSLSLGLKFDKAHLRINFSVIRAQSNLCKVTQAPERKDIEEIDGDGNCLFRALAWWVAGSEWEHAKMRKKIIQFMTQFPDEFGTRMTGEQGQKYTKEANNRMLEDGEWGTQCEIYGAATLLGVDIYTYHEGRWKQYRPLFEWISAGGFTVTRMTECSERTRFGLYLTNPDNLHYDVVKYMAPVAPATPTCYRLIATILHRGATACSGHYVADVYDQMADKWLNCDDEHCTERDVLEVLEKAMDAGYVLVYGKNETVLRNQPKKRREA